MINQELLRTTALTIEMKNMRKKINSKAVFNQRDIRTAMLLCELKMDGEPIELTGCTVSAEILKADGKTVIQKGQIVDEANGVVAIGLTEQCLSSIGEASCEIVVQHDRQILYSPKISYIVVDNLFDTEMIQSTDEFPILNILIAEVQKVQSDLSVLETVITANENTRNSNEEERKSNEEERITKFTKIEEDFDGIVNTNTSKVQEVNDKIIEINGRIVVINDTLSSAVSQMEDTLENVEQSANQKIQEVNEKLIEVDTTLSRLISNVDDKLESVDNTLNEKLNEVDLSLNNKLEEITNLVNSRLDGYNAKISEINNKINEMNTTKQELIDEVSKNISKINETLDDSVKNIKTTLSSEVEKVNEKILGYDNKVVEVNELILNVGTAEEDRIQAEMNRENTFNNIVAELEVNQSDIDEILGMIGGI